MGNPELINFSELPLNFSWENVLGTDYTSQVYDQGACGSCFDIAFTSMLESRIRIKYGRDVGLSTQFTLDCNWLTEGCHGGWGILLGFFTDFFHIVDDMCVPYTGKTGSAPTCQNYKHCKPVARTISTYFVGGKYGAMTEELIMREIRANGPVMLDFAAGNDFMYYADGVLVDNDQVHLKFLEQKKKQEAA